jgi:uncharacterized phage infection (PIP) family protein YhgE
VRTSVLAIDAFANRKNTMLEILYTKEDTDRILNCIKTENMNYVPNAKNGGNNTKNSNNNNNNANNNSQNNSQQANNGPIHAPGSPFTSNEANLHSRTPFNIPNTVQKSTPSMTTSNDETSKVLLSALSKLNDRFDQFEETIGEIHDQMNNLEDKYEELKQSTKEESKRSVYL